MSEALPQFNLSRPHSIEEAVAMLGAEPGATPCAGGTDLIVRVRKNLAAPGTLVDLTGLDELGGISVSAKGVRIGAGVTLRDIEHSQVIADACPAVAKAAAAVAGPSHRQVATLGGNLCLDTRCVYFNQSDWWRKANGYCLKYQGDTCHVAPSGNRCRAAFSGDMAPALMVHGAELEIAGPSGRRRIALADFYAEDGAAHLTLEPGEIVTAAHLRPPGQISDYEKIRVRRAVDFPLAGVAVACDAGRDAASLRIAVTGTNSRPFLVDLSGLPLGGPRDAAFFQALEKQVQKSVSPQRTTMIAPHYRRLSAAALAVRLARRLL